MKSQRNLNLHMNTSFFTTLTLTLLALAAPAAQIDLTAAVAKPILPAGEKHLTHLKVGLTGFAIEQNPERTPVNLSIVLDRSGSMGGPKLVHAREAACMAVRGLAGTDIVSVITFDDSVDVLVPATKASDAAAICQKISSIKQGGGTGLFAGVSKGAGELRKFLSKQSVNRVVLLSDGIANQGPSSPAELGELGGSLIKEGISVTTIGLGSGYNEDLMTRLAEKSDGRHAFVEQPEQLAAIFQDEIGSVNAVVAQKVKIDILCDPGVKPVRVLGREATITGQKVSLQLNQIYSKEEKYLILEIEVPATAAEVHRDLARVEVSYDNLSTHAQDHLTSTVAVSFSNDPQAVEKALNKAVLVAAVQQIGVANNEKALALWDAGKKEEAKAALTSNSSELGSWAAKLDAPSLWMACSNNAGDIKNLETDANAARKVMKDTAYSQKTSQGTDESKAQARRTKP